MIAFHTQKIQTVGQIFTQIFTKKFKYTVHIIFICVLVFNSNDIINENLVNLILIKHS